MSAQAAFTSPGTTQPVTSSSTDSPGHHLPVGIQRRLVPKNKLNLKINKFGFVNVIWGSDNTRAAAVLLCVFVCDYKCVCLVSLRVIRAENNTLGTWRGGLIIPLHRERDRCSFSLILTHISFTYLQTHSVSCFVSRCRLNMIQLNRCSFMTI